MIVALRPHGGIEIRCWPRRTPTAPCAWSSTGGGPARKYQCAPTWPYRLGLKGKQVGQMGFDAARLLPCAYRRLDAMNG